MSAKIKAIILTVVIVLLGFLRGYLFGNINWIYKTLTINRPNGARDEFHFLLEWTPDQILILKWALTFIFFGLFFFLTWLIIKIYFKNKEFNKIVLYSFIGIFAISALLYPIFILAGRSSEVYAVIRTLMGIGQSFMPLMFLWILFKFLPETKSH